MSAIGSYLLGKTFSFLTQKYDNRGAFLKRLIAGALVLAAVAAVSLSLEYPSTTAQSTAFQLTVRNITDRQPLSAPIVVVHEGAFRLPTSASRLDGLEEFAESGVQNALIETLEGRSGVKRVSRFGGTIDPKSQQTLLRVLADPGDHITVMGSLECTNDGIAMGTIIVPDDAGRAFGSGVVWDAGTEVNDESRANVPCLGGDGYSDIGPSDTDERIQRHQGIAVTADLGDVFGWDRTVLEIVMDERGSQPLRAFEVGATIENKTKGQPITPPVVVVHDKNVDVLTYTRPRELPGIAALSESGDAQELMDTLASVPGVVSVTQWQTGGPIAPGDSYSGNARAFAGTTVSVAGMFACTNDGYVVASAEVKGSGLNVSATSSVARVFDSGAENNDETAATVPCLGGDSAGLSGGTGENQRSEHQGISGTGDLQDAVHGWNADTTAVLSLHNRVEVTPVPIPTETPVPIPEPSVEPTEAPEEPETGGQTFAMNAALLAMLMGMVTVMIASLLLWRGRGRSTDV